MRESNTAILDAARKAAPELADAILQSSRADADEEFWTEMLVAADRQAGRSRTRDFSTLRDQLDAIAFHPQFLERGENSLVDGWASDLATLLDQAGGNAEVTGEAVERFNETLTLLLESLGSAQEPSDSDNAPGAAPHATTTLDVDGLHVTVETVAAYNSRLVTLGVSPLRTVTISNTADYSIIVEALQIIGPSGTPEWAAPRCDVPAGDEISLTDAELRWLPTLDSVPAAEAAEAAEAAVLSAELHLANMERSRATELSIPLVPDDAWNPEVPPELLAGIIPFSSTQVAEIALATGKAVSGLEELTDADYAKAVADELVHVADATLDTGIAWGFTPDAATQTNRALLAAAVLERLGCATVLAVTQNGIHTAIGHPETSIFDAASLTRGAYIADVGGLTPVGAAVESTDVLYLVTVADLLERTTIERPVPGDEDGAPAGDAAPVAHQVQTSRPPIVGRWLQELLQLDYRNHLLRMPETAGVRIAVPTTQLSAFEDAFSSGERYDLNSLKKLDESQYEPGAGRTSFDAQLGAHELFCEPLRDGFTKVLARLQTQSEKSREESGKNTLHLAVGALRWTDDRGEQSESPLFVAPANLTGSAESGFGLALEPGYQLEANYTLHEKLRQMTGMSIQSLYTPPTDDSGIDVDQALTQIGHDLQHAGIQHTVLRTVRLLPLDFATQALWSDLRENWATMVDKPVSGQLTRNFGTAFSDPAGNRSQDAPDQVTTTLVEAADGSQLDAIAAASAGQSFVLEGPPGTGKSQTITNMIADGMARGRKILFVAEKRAALDVVYSRLKEAGLENSVLDLHDAKQSLRDARVQLRAALETLPRSTGTQRSEYSLSGGSRSGAPTGQATSGPRTEDQQQAALHASIDLLRTYPEAMFGENGSAGVPAAPEGDAEPAAQNAWALFRTLLELESEFNFDSGWQPDEIDVPAHLTETTAQADTAARDLADLAKKLRRARRRADADQAAAELRAADQGDGAGEADTASPAIKTLNDLADRVAAAGLPTAAAAVRDGRSGDQLAEAIGLARVRAQLERTLGELPTAGTYAERPDAVRTFIAQAEAAIERNRENPGGWLADPARGDVLSPAFDRFVRRNSPGSVRELFDAFADEVLALTPCVLMSPLGVAKHLPAGSVEFDTVIFDEASQIRPANALSAMGRARSAVIVGDRKQMPPPTEFSGRVEDEPVGPGISAALDQAVQSPGIGGAGAPTPASQGRLESLLTLAGKAGLEQKALDWHYRSSNEALIAFSNRTYYQGKLITFPNPPVGSMRLPIRYQYVGGVQEREPGFKGKVNRAERDAVITEIHRRLAAEPEHSIMVVTFNAVQQEYISQALEESKDPLIVEAMGRRVEPLAVKNVETVQGDERDVVLFSMTFAPDKTTGKQSNNFGPIARGGGELRFNVAITRARQEIVVFASLRADDIKISKNTRQGVRDLRRYLLMAETGHLPRVESSAPGTDLFRSRVADALRERGFEVVEKVGESEFAVDLAVREGARGTWQAVLLDSPHWADRATVWDRDGLPVSILEGRMHWSRVDRLLSADWAVDPDGAVERLVKRLRAPADGAGSAGGGPLSSIPVISGDGSDGSGSYGTDSGGTGSEGAGSGGSYPYSSDRAADGDADTQGEAGQASDGTSGNSGVVEAEYQEASVRPVDDKDLLDNADRVPEAREKIVGHIEQIVAIEGPIAWDELLKKVAFRLSFKRPRDRTLEKIGSLVQQRVTVDDDGRRFVWPDMVDPSTYNVYRTPGPGSAARGLPDMCQRELGNAIVAVLSGEQHLFGDALLEQVVELFGGQRRTKAARDALDRAVAVGLRERRIEMDFQGRFTLVE